MALKQNLWRSTGIEPKFWKFDWRLSVFFLFIFLDAFSLYPYLIMISFMTFFHILNMRGLNIKNFFRLIKYNMLGPKIHGKPKWFQRKF